VVEFFLSVKIRVIFIAILLILAVSVTFLAAHATVSALQDIHQHEILKSQGDVRLIQAWMTIPYIAHIYHVPEPTLYETLLLKGNPTVIRHSTLETIAIYKKQPVDNVIHKVQNSILVYRKAHPHKPVPTPKTCRGGQAHC